jgi:hypothetical protein
MITLTQLHSFIPALVTTDPVALSNQQAAITITFAENCGYLGLPPAVRDIAQALAAASFMQSGKEQPKEVNQYKSYDDQITYFSRPPTDKNPYKTALDKILDTHSFPVSAEGSCGDCGDPESFFYLG